MKYFPPLLVLIFLISIKSRANDEFQNAVYNSDLKKIESIVKSKIKELAKQKEISNFSKLDSLENWFKSKDFVKKAYWNKNQAYILTTLTFIQSMAVQFKTKDSIAELCFQIMTQKQKFGDFLYWRFGLDIPDNRLRYVAMQSCKGYIQQMASLDSLSGLRREIEKHNNSVRFSMQIVDKNGNFDNYHIKSEGEAIYAKITVHNFTDSLKIIPWRGLQNRGPKMLCFSLYDNKKRLLFTENRQVSLIYGDGAYYDLLRLEAGEKKEFLHVINGDCFDSNFEIDCDHNLGLIKEGEYYLQAWYNPFGPEYPNKVWLPLEMDSLAIYGDQFFRSARDLSYFAKLANLGPNDRNDIEKRSEVICEIEVLGGAGKYTSKIGEMKYDAWGIVKSVQKGDLQIGDSIAFSIRHQEDLEKLNSLKKGKVYKIYCSSSHAECFQIPHQDLPALERGSMPNLQLVDFKGSIKKI